jgi:hypothetical protein
LNFTGSAASSAVEATACLSNWSTSSPEMNKYKSRLMRLPTSLLSFFNYYVQLNHHITQAAPQPLGIAVAESFFPIIGIVQKLTIFLFGQKMVHFILRFSRGNANRFPVGLKCKLLREYAPNGSTALIKAAMIWQARGTASSDNSVLDAIQSMSARKPESPNTSGPPALLFLLYQYAMYIHGKIPTRHA